MLTLHVTQVILTSTDPAGSQAGLGMQDGPKSHVKKLLQETGCDKCFRYKAFDPAGR